jgi:hypothetical protein
MGHRNLAITILFGMIAMTNGSTHLRPANFTGRTVAVVVAPAGDPAAETQRRIYESSAKGMSERAIILTEALDASERSRQIRSWLAADGRRFRVFLVGKDGHTAISSDKPLSADLLFAQVDAIPMREDEMRRARLRRESSANSWQPSEPSPAPCGRRRQSS